MNSADSTAQGKSKDNPKAAALPPRRPGFVWAGAVAFVAVIASWIVFLGVSGKAGALEEVDLTVYRDGGLIVRHVTPYYNPHAYRPALRLGRYSTLALKFTYTPFAAIAFALISFIPLEAA